MNREAVVPGDIYYMPAGRVHAIGAGVLLAEIQQTSDVTYRIYDWDRTDDEGKSRELHTDLALDAIDFQFHKEYKTHYRPIENSTITAVDTPFFTTGVIKLDKPVEKDFNLIDSFVIYMCMEGEAGITYPGGVETIKKGETDADSRRYEGTGHCTDRTHHPAGGILYVGESSLASPESLP